ncbi:hypothetical protein ABZP36_029981 [Zizania latifolia]
MNPAESRSKRVAGESIAAATGVGSAVDAGGSRRTSDLDGFTQWSELSPSSSSSGWLYPPGGYVNYLQGQLPENFYFVGGPMSHSTMSPITPCAAKTPSPTGNPAVDTA